MGVSDGDSANTNASRSAALRLRFWSEHDGPLNSNTMNTADKDSGELVYRRQQLSTGVVLVRLAGVAPHLKAQLVLSAVTQLGDALADAFSVITSTSVHHRPPRVR
jgi:hypothetical protein